MLCPDKNAGGISDGLASHPGGGITDSTSSSLNVMRDIYGPAVKCSTSATLS